MKKTIAAIIATANAFLAIGTCGALECDTISLGSAFVRCLVFSVIVFASLHVVRNEERVEQEEARRPVAPCRLIPCPSNPVSLRSVLSAQSP